MNKREYQRARKRHMKKMAEDFFAPITSIIRPIYQRLRKRHGAAKAKAMLNDALPPFYVPPMRVGKEVE